MKSEEKTTKQLNQELDAVKRELEQAHAELEKRVEERTAKLVEANNALKHEIIERQQADLEIVQRNFELFVLQSAGAAMASSLDLKQVLYTVTHEMTRLLDVEGCEISDWDQTKDTIVTIAGYSNSSWWTETRFDDIYNLSDYPLTQEVLIDQVACQVNVSQPDVDPAELIYMKTLNLKTLIMLPMVCRGQTIGLVELIDTGYERVLTEQELDLAQLLANQAASAIENARLYQAERTRHNQVEALNRAALALISTTDLDQVFERILTELQHVVPYDSASIQLLKGNDMEIIGGRGFTELPKIVGLTFPVFGNTPNAEILKTRRPLIIDDAVINYPLFNEEPHAPANIHGWMGVPMIIGDQIIGMLTLDKHQSGFYTEDHAKTASVYAVQAAIAIENARLYSQAQQEIEDRKRAESTAIVSRDTLQRLIQQLPIGVQIFDTNGLCIDINQALMQIFGIENREDSVGKFNLFIDDMARKVGTEAAGREALSGKIVHLPELFFDFKASNPLYNPPNPHRILAVTFFPVKDANNNVIEIVALNEDITKRKQAEEVLILERKHLAATLRSIGDGVIAMDNSGFILLTNPIAEAYLKLLIDAEIKKLLICPNDKSLANWLTTLSGTETPYELVITSNPQRIFEVDTHPITTDLLPGGQVIVIRDVTESRWVHERNQQQQRLAAVGQLAAGIAHDFNNILTSVIGFAELLQTDPTISLTAQSDLGRIVQQGQRGAHLIRQILDFSRQTVTTKQPVDLAQFLKETVELLQRTIPENVELSVGIKSGNFLINADVTQLQQMLTNLAVNAWDAMPIGGKLHFALSTLVVQPGQFSTYPEIPPGNWIKLAVSDTGMGMSSQVKDHIFEPFFTTKDVNKGTGLGLSQVDGIVKQHDGFIYAESHENKGTTFILYFPVISSTTYNFSQMDVQGIPHGQRETILLVEDNVNVLNITQKMLIHLNYQVLTAVNGVQALEMYNKFTNDIKLVLTDVNMPEMGGLALSKELIQRDPTIKVVALTGYPLEDDSKELLMKGIVSWMSKPFQIDQLAKVVHKTLHSTDQ